MSPPPRSNSRRSARSVEEVGSLQLAARGAADFVGRRRGADRRRHPAREAQQCDPGFLAVAEAGARIGAVDYLGADLVRNALGRTMGAFHETYDLLLTPMMPVPALPVGEDLNDPGDEHWVDWSPFSYPFNMTRQPAASIPCGLTRTACRSGCRSSARCTTTPGAARRPRLRGDAAACAVRRSEEPTMTEPKSSSPTRPTLPTLR